MLKEDWEELEAQVESHGPNEVKFFLMDSADETEDWLELIVNEVKFEDGVVKVVVQ